MTADLNRFINIQYCLGNNLPLSIMHPQGRIVNHYTLSGTKLGKMLFDRYGNLTYQEQYYGDLVIKDGQPTRILHGDGTISLNGSSVEYHYHLKDHLGNVRLVIAPDGNNQPVVLQANDYYPFGMAYTKNFQSGGGPQQPNKYLYNSKEEQEMPGKFLDYGWRMYDAQLGRWHGVDPLAEKYSRWSPYVYTLNNPIRFIDPDGLQVTDPLRNPYIRAAVSPNVQNKVAERKNIGSVASVTAGVQAGGAKAEVNLLGTNFEIGGTVGKVEYSAELNSTGITQKGSVTAAEGTANVDMLGKIGAGLDIESGKAAGTLSSDGNIGVNYTGFEASPNLSKGDASINITGDIGFKLSAGNITAGASLNPINLLKSVNSAISTFTAYLNEVANEIMNPQRSLPEEIRY